MKKLLFGLLLMGCSAMGAMSQGRPAAQSPNIIVILTDDQGYGDVGFNGCKDIPTPNIDRIAKNGAVFTSGYVSYAVCGPSRAGLLTGRYQDRFGFSKNPLLAVKDSTMGLPVSEQTVAQLLKKMGYATGGIGKWHMGAHPSQRPLKRGFDEFFGFLGGGHRYFPEEYTFPDITFCKSEYDSYRTKLLRNEARIEETEYLTDALSREAVSFVNRHQQRPFFLYLAYNAPHAPMQATEKYLNRFPNIADPKRRTYAAMVSAVDDGVGALLDELERLGIANNTIVFFLSDNGGPTKDNASNNAPLRGFKSDFFEGGIRVPFAVQWPGQVPAGIRYEHPVISLDIFATAAALSGATPKNDLDGVNLIPYLQGKEKNAPHPALFWRNHTAKRFAMRTPDRKMIVQPSDSFLFDIQQDISEKNNVFAGREKEVKKLQKQLDKWKKILQEPAFLGLEDAKAYKALHPDQFE